MERHNRIRQLYGYTVCLVAVITSLICLSSVVDNAIGLTDPLAAGGSYAGDLRSFESWMASRERYPSDSPADTASVTTLRARFDALQSSHLTQTRFQMRKELITQFTLLAVAVALFLTHWRWLRQMPDVHDTAPPA